MLIELELMCSHSNWSIAPHWLDRVRQSSLTLNQRRWHLHWFASNDWATISPRSRIISSRSTFISQCFQTESVNSLNSYIEFAMNFNVFINYDWGLIVTCIDRSLALLFLLFLSITGRGSSQFFPFLSTCLSIKKRTIVVQRSGILFSDFSCFLLECSMMDLLCLMECSTRLRVSGWTAHDGPSYPYWNAQQMLFRPYCIAQRRLLFSSFFLLTLEYVNTGSFRRNAVGSSVPAGLFS